MYRNYDFGYNIIFLDKGFSFFEIFHPLSNFILSPISIISIFSKIIQNFYIFYFILEPWGLGQSPNYIISIGTLSPKFILNCAMV